MGAIWQSYEYLVKQPQQQQPVISLKDRQPVVVNTTRFPPQAIQQVNRATTKIDVYKNKDSNSTKEDLESDDTRKNFIAFSSLLARNFNNPNFAQFAKNLCFSGIFRAYRDRNDETRPQLMSFFIRVANIKDLALEYLNEMKEILKRFDVIIDQSYEQYLRNTYNTIKDMFTADGFNG